MTIRAHSSTAAWLLQCFVYKYVSHCRSILNELNEIKMHIKLNISYLDASE